MGNGDQVRWVQMVDWSSRRTASFRVAGGWYTSWSTSSFRFHAFTFRNKDEKLFNFVFYAKSKLLVGLGFGQMASAGR